MPRVPWTQDVMPQPEEAIFFLLTPDNKNGLTLGSRKMFCSRILFFILFFTFFKFLLSEYIPTVLESILTVALFTLLTLFLLFFLLYFNTVIKKHGIKGFFLLFVLTLIVII